MKLNFIKRPKQGILTLFSAIVIMLFLPLGTATWVSMTRSDLAREQKQIILIKEQTAAVQSALTDMESGQRGYIITGKPNFLEPYHQGNKQLAIVLPQLRENLPPDAETQSDIVELSRLIEFKQFEMDRTIKIRAIVGLNDAKQIIAAGVGKQYMDEIRALVTKLTERQTARVAELSNQLKWRSTLSLIVGCSTIAICIGLLTILTVCLFRLVDRQKILYDERTDLIERISKAAYFDDLTTLPNRSMFNDESEKIHKRAVEQGSIVSLFLIDIDNFKIINDTYGHACGDKVLSDIGHRLNTFVHAYCNFCRELGRCKYKCNCLAARLGGDEFVVMFEHIDKAHTDIMAQKLMEELKEAIDVGSIKINLSASIGVSLFPESGDTVSDLLASADLAMYAAKEQGKDQFCFHDDSMDFKAQRRVDAELAVRDMINENNIVVYYQPIIGTEDGEILGSEALLRGKGVTDKFFNPVELITAAEDANLIVPLGSIILKNACKFTRQCLDAIGEDSDLFVSVNVSPHQLAHEGFVHLVERTLQSCNLRPTHLVLEITETMLMQNFEESERALNKLRSLGVRISIDDFGKGYSSFSYLQRLPIDKIKIDISFVQSLGVDLKSNEIVKGIVLMAEALGMHTCAEGVETELQFNKLKEFGCEQVQGYYKHKALAENEFLDLLQ